jgi:hypothetical protein
MDPLFAIERLAGLQAQSPHAWYIGLWGRLAPFEPAEAGDLLTERRAVRMALMRGAMHIVSAADALWMRPLLAPVISGALGRHAHQLEGVDMVRLARAARAMVESEPHTPAALGARLAERWPGRDPAALAHAARAHLGLVQVPPRGVWRRSGPAAHTTIEKWLAKPLSGSVRIERLVMHYLAAFGPATPADCRAWSGLPLADLEEAFARMRPDLAVLEDEHGAEYLDLPDAPRPDPGTEAPVRLLYDHDNLLRAHADRARFHRPQGAHPSFAHRPVPPGTVLVDGLVRGTWTLSREPQGGVVLAVARWGRFAAADSRAVQEEASALMAFIAPGSEGKVALTSA